MLGRLKTGEHRWGVEGSVFGGAEDAHPWHGVLVGRPRALALEGISPNRPLLRQASTPLQAAVFAAFDVSSIRLSFHRIIISTIVGKNETTRRTPACPQTGLVGYTRVSTEGQEVTLQPEALRRHGCQARTDLYGYHLGSACASARTRGLYGELAAGRCARSLASGSVRTLDAHLVTLVEELRQRGVGFRSLSDGMIDTTTASGKLIFHLFSALGQFEQRLIQERTRAGLQAARARGRKGGWKPLDPQAPRVQMAKAMHRDSRLRIADICHTLHISRATFYRYRTLHEAQDRQSHRAARTTS
jgi:DNA invertase Pin-like site-specific DNA recombinase